MTGFSQNCGRHIANSILSADGHIDKVKTVEIDLSLKAIHIEKTGCTRFTPWRNILIRWELSSSPPSTFLKRVHSFKTRCNPCTWEITTFSDLFSYILLTKLIIVSYPSLNSPGSVQVVYIPECTEADVYCLFLMFSLYLPRNIMFKKMTYCFRSNELHNWTYNAFLLHGNCFKMTRSHTVPSA